MHMTKGKKSLKQLYTYDSSCLTLRERQHDGAGEIPPCSWQAGERDEGRL